MLGLAVIIQVFVIIVLIVIIVIIVVVIILVELMRVIVGSRSKPFPKTKTWENTKQFGNS